MYVCITVGAPAEYIWDRKTQKKGDFEVCVGRGSMCIHVRWHGPQANSLGEGGANQPLNELLEQHKGKPNLKWICECMVCTLC